MKEDLTKAESRWRKKQLFGPKPSRPPVWPWLLLLVVLAAAFAYLYFKGIPTP